MPAESAKAPPTADQVVVGYDASTESEAAAEWAAAEAASRGTGVHLLNVWHPPARLQRLTSDRTDGEGMRAWEEERLTETAQRLTARHQALTVTASQVTGAPGHVLLDAAGSARMLVLGSRRPGGIAGAFYGSVSLHVLAHSPGPVVMVGTADTWAGPGGKAEVVVGVDPAGPGGGALLDFAFQEAAARGSVLRVVHVWEMHRMYGSPVLDRGLEHALRQERQQELSRFLAPWRGDYEGVQVVEDVPSGPVAQVLVHDAREGTALIVVGRHHKRTPAGVRIGAVAHGVVHHAPCPVAVVSHE